MNKAAFFDRDGTINVDVHYLYRPEDFVFIPGVPQLIKMLRDAGYLIIVVTNQAGIARGYYTETDMHRLHRYINTQLAMYDTVIDQFYFCPHHPVHGIGDYKTVCDCRKPQPGMLLEAISNHNIDPHQSVLFGDKPWDLEAGRRCGIASYDIYRALQMDWNSLLL